MSADHSATTSTDHLRSALKQTTPVHSHIPLPSSNSGSLKSSPVATRPPIHSRRSSPSIPLHSAFNHHHAHSPQFAGAGYTPKVSFDTFENPNSISSYMFSYTLHVQSAGYARTRATRVFLCAASSDESGSQALDWALDALARDGDELIVLRGIDPEELEKDHELVRGEARDLLKVIQEKCVEYDPDRKLSITVEFVAGRVTQTLDRLIALYRPDSLVVGTRGQRTVMQALGMSMTGSIGSVSKYCLSHSPVPVIVVRPEEKVRKAMAKRRKDPKRGRHFEEEMTRTKTLVTSVPISLTPTTTNTGR
ncbi:adenine nucleotide alpha hydrolases-like protein [Athelia psychrophila]|uniref:Adenine nucleotide alpha hydrolases-like protein n=1 Tax=Athelia psychrophila TaxID=1759441 RepID=A0A166QXJ4_9AGAM|nr:adenine nucleotide alpha hydrolases-like protein [Fibularhizoctonia sp. CBS 109695]